MAIRRRRANAGLRALYHLCTTSPPLREHEVPRRRGQSPDLAPSQRASLTIAETTARRRARELRLGPRHRLDSSVPIPPAGPAVACRLFWPRQLAPVPVDMPQVESRPRSDRFPATNANRKTARDQGSDSLSHRLMHAAVPAPLTRLPRPTCPHLRRRPMLTAARTVRAPRLSAAALTRSLVHASPASVRDSWLVR